jgi:GNAT superfamily N-acetyltransferase
MSETLFGLSPAELTRAVEQSRFAWVTLPEDWPRRTIRREPDLLWRISEIPFFIFNGLAWADFAPEEADARIEAVLAEFRARGLPGGWWVTPSSRPADLGARLLEHGLSGPEISPGMAADLSAVPDSAPLPEGVTLHPVTGDDLLRAYVSVFRDDFPPAVMDAMFDQYRHMGWGPDRPIKQFVAMQGDQALGTAAALIRGEVAGLYNVVTVEAARRRGIGMAASLAALKAAREAGCRIAVLEATEMGAGIYRRIGFQDVCRMEIYRFEAG